MKLSVRGEYALRALLVLGQNYGQEVMCIQTIAEQQNIHGDALPQFDEAEQNMLRAEIIMIEAVGFLAREREHLLRARCEIAHGFVAHTGNIMLRVGRFVQCV